MKDHGKEGRDQGKYHGKDQGKVHEKDQENDYEKERKDWRKEGKTNMRTR